MKHLVNTWSVDAAAVSLTRSGAIERSPTIPLDELPLAAIPIRADVSRDALIAPQRAPRVVLSRSRGRPWDAGRRLARSAPLASSLGPESGNERRRVLTPPLGPKLAPRPTGAPRGHSLATSVTESWRG
jgi:hypothetical protein